MTVKLFALKMLLLAQEAGTIWRKPGPGRMWLMAENWLSKLNGNPLEWMLESNPWTRYGTLTELMDYPRDDIETEAALLQ